jgi:hypothetical protein
VQSRAVSDFFLSFTNPPFRSLFVFMTRKLKRILFLARVDERKMLVLMILSRAWDGRERDLGQKGDK